ncbi:MAG TPA: cupin domain-containing protein [Candidatus Lumbricidophila sp.]|nr:cupin domain-containing protein [Candidatus Lumbricidophila sp.]
MQRPVDVSSAPHYAWGAGCDGWRLVDAPDLSVIEELVPPGEAEHWHFHERAHQFFYILSGTAVMRMAHADVALTAGQGVEVAPGVAHQFGNPGPDEVRFLVVSTPSTTGDRVLVDEPVNR